MKPETTEQTESRRKRQRENSRRYRSRWPERARESRRKSDSKRRRGTGWTPKCERKKTIRKKKPAVVLNAVYSRLRERLLQSRAK